VSECEKERKKERKKERERERERERKKERKRLGVIQGIFARGTVAHITHDI
jgi:hypothetical protein